MKSVAVRPFIKRIRSRLKDRDREYDSYLSLARKTLKKTRKKDMRNLSLQETAFAAFRNFLLVNITVMEDNSLTNKALLAICSILDGLTRELEDQVLPATEHIESLRKRIGSARPKATALKTRARKLERLKASWYKLLESDAIERGLWS